MGYSTAPLLRYLTSNTDIKVRETVIDNIAA